MYAPRDASASSRPTIESTCTATPCRVIDVICRWVKTPWLGRSACGHMLVTASTRSDAGGAPSGYGSEMIGALVAAPLWRPRRLLHKDLRSPSGRVGLEVD